VKVLVIDDAHVVRTRLAAMLGEVPGAAVVEAATAAAALRAFRTEAPDVVVLDLHLAGESGLDLVPHAKRDCPAALLVVLTNDPSEHHRRECAWIGVHFFFDKSRDFDRVVEIVTEVARSDRGRA
jgi:DNA-binding NarL/FixJ family response regulator